MSFKNSLLLNKNTYNNWNILYSKDANSLASDIASHLEDSLSERLSQDSPKPIGLATGKTMLPIYRSLVQRLLLWKPSNLQKLLSEWCSFNLDEYVGIPSGDRNSFLHYMKTNLADPLNLDVSKINIPKGSSNDLIAEVYSYSKGLNEYGGLGLQILGIGLNGHIGFNEPPSGPESKCRVVTLSNSTISQNFPNSRDIIKNVPKYAITLGLSEILEAEEINLIVIGKSKSHILKKLIYSELSNDLPASWLKKHKNVYIWADSNALDF